MIRVTVEVSCDLCAQWTRIDQSEFVADPAPVARHTITVVLDKTPPKTWMVVPSPDPHRPLHLRFCPPCVADWTVYRAGTTEVDDAATRDRVLTVYRTHRATSEPVNA